MKSVEDLFDFDGREVHVVERTADGQLSAPLARLETLAPWLRIFAARCNGDPCPRVSIQGSSTHGEITFLGALEGRLLEPFAILLRDLARGHADLDTPATRVLLQDLQVKRGLSIAVSATCPRCPRTLGTALSVAICSAYIDVVVARADLGLGPAVASVPSLWVDGVELDLTEHREYALAERLLSGPPG